MSLGKCVLSLIGMYSFKFFCKLCQKLKVFSDMHIDVIGRDFIDCFGFKRKTLFSCLNGRFLPTISEFFYL